MSVYLKVKLKSLAAEARIIRREEHKARDSYVRERLCIHRRTTVRREARHTLLAYGYLRGRAYRQLENKCHAPPSSSEIERMVRRYGKVRDEDVGTWLKRN